MTNATFGVTLSGNFPPIQLIYGGKTCKSLPHVEFPESFCLGLNKTNCSNETEPRKFVNEDIVPYLYSERVTNLPNQYGLVVMDVFKGQMTNKVLGFLEDNLVLHEKVTANMTHSIFNHCT